MPYMETIHCKFSIHNINMKFVRPKLDNVKIL